MRKIWILLIFCAWQAAAQDSLPAPKWELNGYLKNMQTLSFSKDFQQLAATNLLHNRLNLKWKPTERLTLAAEWRNRLLWGDDVRATPNYAEQLRNPNESAKLWLAATTPALVLHLNTERLWLQYKGQKWLLRLGRQRLNWGITTVWNPNDIFNTYNFLDFDYEERPGSDAAKFQYNFNDFSNIEMAYAPGSGPHKGVGAVKYFINTGGYDVQFIAGVYQNRLTLGGGWAGSLRNAGFKGEIQYFAPRQPEKGHLNASLECDYAFEKGWYINGGLLYNSEGIGGSLATANSLNFSFSPLNLMPTQWNFVLATAKEITPLLSFNVSVLYAPGPQLTLLLPSLRYNLAANLDVDLVWQSFFAELQTYEALNHRAFLRAKWNF